MWENPVFEGGYDRVIDFVHHSGWAAITMPVKPWYYDRLVDILLCEVDLAVLVADGGVVVFVWRKESVAVSRCNIHCR